MNALLAKTSIDLPGDPGAGRSVDDWFADADDQPEGADRLSIALYRVFNDGSFRRGGRFYGGWWQALGKDQRSRLLINDQPTIELDFASLHPRLCYQLEGQPLPHDSDPYLVAGISVDHRALAKRAFGQLLNSSGAPIRAPRGEASSLPRGWTWARLIAALEGHHAPIASWFRSGRGLELQAIDAAIADSVLHALALRGIPCLPVHDSFIVPRKFERTLGEAMLLAYHGQLGRLVSEPALPLIRGWSSADIEQKVMASVSSLEIVWNHDDHGLGIRLHVSSGAVLGHN